MVSPSFLLPTFPVLSAATSVPGPAQLGHEKIRYPGTSTFPSVTFSKFIIDESEENR